MLSSPRSFVPSDSSQTRRGEFILLDQKKRIELDVGMVVQFWQFFSEQKWEDAKRLLSLDLIVEWAQSRERMKRAREFH
jgi:hypothetical protein